ncbi:hypothetical protein [Nostoc sp.]
MRLTTAVKHLYIASTGAVPIGNLVAGALASSMGAVNTIQLRKSW